MQKVGFWGVMISESFYEQGIKQGENKIMYSHDSSHSDGNY